MSQWMFVVACTAILFFAMILQLAMKPKAVSVLTGVFIVVAACSGLYLYGRGYATLCPNGFIAVVRSLLAVCGMFVAKIDDSVVKSEAVWKQAWFWAAHLMALYATASTAVAAIGTEALMKLRMWLARWGDLHLIYGLTPSTLEFAKALLAEKKGSVLFVDAAPDGAMATAATKAGCALRTDSNALSANVRFLKRIGVCPGRRKITLYAIGGKPEENLPYAKAFLASLQERGVHPEQTTLVIPAKEELVVSKLQNSEDCSGYGFVNCYQESSLAARVLIQQAPPWESLAFDGDGRAEEDFEALLIGFGQMGQAVLRQLVMNAQFAGSRFRADVFAPNCHTETGYFTNSFGALAEQYSIHFHADSAHSIAMYQHLRERGHTLNYVVVCAGSDKANREIAEDFSMVLHRMGINRPIHLCSYGGVSSRLPDGTFTKPYKLYQPEVLSAERLDRMAMLVHHHYMSEDGKTPLQHWMECNYFKRMSNRAAADFLPAMVRAAGKTVDRVLAGDWALTETQKENLAQMEHMRWNAFHFAMGFRTMSDEEFAHRAQRYLELVREQGTADYSITKNMRDYTHACLVDWDALQDLAEREQQITGRPVDYKEYDRANVMLVPELLKLNEER